VRTDIAAHEIALLNGLPRAAHAPHIAQIDGFDIRPLDAQRDARTLHGWFIEERAAFWNMRDWTVEQVAAFYQDIADSRHAKAWLASQHGEPAFLIESYDPAHEEVGEHYDTRAGDLGMHLFVGPAATPVPGHTRRVFKALMRFLFDHLDAQRIIVEPDAHNTRIHALNRAMGFVYWKDVAFREKTASLAFCTRADFFRCVQKDH
jgi:RimJ/RimL family protein N-acetyltransferase